MYRRADGIVDFDKRICIGCKACIAACPYDAIFINPEDHSAEKCNFCTHRLDIGLEPACVVVCPTEAILVGDVNDPSSKVARIVNREPVTVRRPEKETHPKLFYKGAHQATLDPIAARRPSGDLYMWSEQGEGVRSGHPGGWSNSSAAAVLSYDIPHKAPWDWRVSLYTWTKSIAAGVYLAPVLLMLLGVEAFAAFGILPSVLGLPFLAVTGALLVWDLEHPKRFYYIFTRPQWRSWLVRGGAIIVGYGLVLVLSLFATDPIRALLVIAGLPLSLMAAAYTAYLFAQAKGRDLWQSPLLPPHMAVQAVLAGSAALLVVTGDEWPVATVLTWASVVHLLFVLGETTLPHGTAHAHLAVWEMTRGRYSSFFWTGVALVLIGSLAPWIGVWAAPAALIGLLAHEHAYVQAGQAVPLA
jgi:ferredoxin/formate-dependent nitrite reductase membrane component NrfD